MLLISGLTYGGAERQVVELANNLDPDQFTVTVCTLTSRNPLGRKLRKDLFVVKKVTKYDLSVVPRLRRIVAERKIDVIHSFLNDANIAGRLCLGRKGRPVIISSERNSYYKESLLRRIVERVTRPCMHLMLCNSMAGKQFCKDDRRIREDRVSVVHNGVDSERFRPDQELGKELRKELKISADKQLVGMAGNYKEQKNHRLFVMMAAKIAAENSESHFVIVGNPLEGSLEDNKYYNEIHELSNQLGLLDRMTFLTARSDMERFYNACDITVLPSSREGTPNVMLESMACGTPMVATDVADNAFVLQDGVDGRVISLEDHESTAAEFAGAVGELLNDDARREEMGNAARRRVEEEFSLRRLAEKTADIYNTLLSAS